MRELKCSVYLKHLSPSLSPGASMVRVLRRTASGAVDVETTTGGHPSRRRRRRRRLIKFGSTAALIRRRLYEASRDRFGRVMSDVWDARRLDTARRRAVKSGFQRRRRHRRLRQFLRDGYPS